MFHLVDSRHGLVDEDVRTMEEVRERCKKRKKS